MSPDAATSLAFDERLRIRVVTMAWLLLDMAIIAQRAMDKTGRNDYYTGKIMQATYFTDVTLPVTMARLETCLRSGREITEIPEQAF